MTVDRVVKPDAEIELDVPGSCLCRGVRFRITGPALRFYICHCSRCRKESGSAFATNLFVKADGVVWMSGEHHVTRFELPEAERFCVDFCATCGTNVPYLTRNGDFYIVPVGTVDIDTGVRPSAQIFWTDRAAWFEAAMSCPGFDGYGPLV